MRSVMESKGKGFFGAGMYIDKHNMILISDGTCGVNTFDGTVVFVGNGVDALGSLDTYYKADFERFIGDVTLSQ